MSATFVYERRSPEAVGEWPIQLRGLGHVDYHLSLSDALALRSSLERAIADAVSDGALWPSRSAGGGRHE